MCPSVHECLSQMQRLARLVLGEQLEQNQSSRTRADSHKTDTFLEIICDGDESMLFS